MKLLCLVLFSVLILVKARFDFSGQAESLAYKQECDIELKEEPSPFCHLHCLVKKMGLFDDETGINPEKMLKQWMRSVEKPEEDIKKVIADCIKGSEDKKEDKCLWAFSGTVCIKQVFEE